jgi:hypothetical protein
VEVKVTTSAASTGPFLKGSTGFGILPLSKCPASRCKAASAEPPTVASERVDSIEGTNGSDSSSNAAAAHDFPKPPGSGSQSLSGASSGAAPDAASAAALSGSRQPGPICTPSDLGYQCSSKLSDGVVLHWSYGGHAPANVCTNTTSLNKALANATDLLHFAIDSDLPVWGQGGWLVVAGAAER